ncbi:hypothetical protein KBI52_29690 [Microvirga sp. HBU67558]|uniref:hypothetical protein n=1 Tax=Microvirga TaxID=186650 RepID=UPI001B376179|nr:MULTISPECIES: hypothetical protein [unclassified Microvirga]MBQ0824372.1 hypothetical protein [Microvirga sp. HBU67558]
MSDMIPVLTDGPNQEVLENPDPSGILPDLREIASNSVPHVVELGLETVQANIHSVIQKTTKAVSDGGLTNTGWKVSELKISLTIDGNGQVSLFSLTRAQLGARATLEVKVVRE